MWDQRQLSAGGPLMGCRRRAGGEGERPRASGLVPMTLNVRVGRFSEGGHQISRAPAAQPSGGWHSSPPLTSGAAGNVLSGGLGDLLKQFQQNGHGEAASSWVGTGQNQDISENDLAKSIGADDLDALTRHTGLSRDDLLATNAGIVRQDREAVAEITALLNDEQRYGDIRSRAIATWQDTPLYADSVLGACRELL